MLLGAILTSAVCLVGIAFLQVRTPLPLLVALLALSGTVRSIGFSAYNSAAFADVEPGRMTKANALMSTLQELGAGLRRGRRGTPRARRRPVAEAAGRGGRRRRGFRVAFVLLAVVLVVPAIEALRLARTAGSAVTGRA